MSKRVRSNQTFAGFDEAVVLDVETTGFSPTNDRVVSVAMIRSRFGVLIDGYNDPECDCIYELIDPERSIPTHATRVHGIVSRDVRGKPTFFEMASELREFIGSLPIIAHNASFDMSFLRAEFFRAGEASLEQNRVLCTMQRFQEFNRGTSRGSKLTDAVRVFRLKGRRSNIHDAKEDAFMAWHVARAFYKIDNGV